jgi:hypothetical protein
VTSRPYGSRWSIPTQISGTVSRRGSCRSGDVRDIQYVRETDWQRSRSKRHESDLPVAALHENPPIEHGEEDRRTAVLVGYPREAEIAVVFAQDRVGVERDPTAVVARERLNIKALGTSTYLDEATVWFRIDQPDEPERWDEVEEQLNRVRGVRDVVSFVRRPRLSNPVD